MSGDADPTEAPHDLGWFEENARLPWWGPWVIRVLKLNPIPQHIAFIMDGNRRYARSKQLGSVIKGHSKGFEQLTKVLEWCSELGVREITCYAFSIENFKRSQEEVDGLIRMAEQKFAQLLEEKAFLNVCMAYTSRDEMTRGMENIRLARQEGIVDEDSAGDPELFAASLDTAQCRPLDMLIRTSGEKRLSDFMLWQCFADNTYIHFDEVLWPDFGFSNLLLAVFRYQMELVQRGQLPDDVNNRAERSATRAKLVDSIQGRRFAEWSRLVQVDAGKH